MPNKGKTKTIKVDYLTRVEGETALVVKIRQNRVGEVQLRIFEPPRFFEALLRGRSFSEAPDITARICGICPVAYQMSAVSSVEQAFGMRVSEPIRTLRRLLYCGEWIESHALHVYMLHAPDFLGYQGALEMGKDHPDLLERGLRLKKAGNEIIRLIGGREIHPVNVRVGGFYKVPSRREISSLAAPLEQARNIAVETARWAADLPFADFERDYTFVALRHGQEYPMSEGRLVSNKGLDIPVNEYEDHFEEVQVAHSNALHAVQKGAGCYLVGPLARYNLNFDRLSPLARETALQVGLTPVCRNPFKSIIVRGVEMVFACDEALRLVADYVKPDPPAEKVHPRSATGTGCTEAPRGILWHRYRTDDEGMILDARIVPPTSQNQGMIEADLRDYVSDRIHLSDEALTWQCEQVIRNYDPCISCATHFLKIRIDRSPGPAVPPAW